MMNHAKKVIVMADSSKFENVSFSVICPVKAVSMIITSDDIDKRIIEEYEEVGVEIITT
ncbi:Glucitol operon repressor [compost metagenome]